MLQSNLYALKPIEVEANDTVDLHIAQSHRQAQAVEAQNAAAAAGTSLSWADTMKAGHAAAQLAGDVRQPPLIYSSRTHSQLTQVIRELRRTSYKCDLPSRSYISLPKASPARVPLCSSLAGDSCFVVMNWSSSARSSRTASSHGKLCDHTPQPASKNAVLVMQAPHVHPGLQAADVRAPDRVQAVRVGVQPGLQGPHLQAPVSLVRCSARPPRLLHNGHPQASTEPRAQCRMHVTQVVSSHYVIDAYVCTHIHIYIYSYT